MLTFFKEIQCNDNYMKYIVFRLRIPYSLRLSKKHESPKTVEK